MIALVAVLLFGQVETSTSTELVPETVRESEFWVRAERARIAAEGLKIELERCRRVKAILKKQKAKIERITIDTPTPDCLPSDVEGERAPIVRRAEIEWMWIVVGAGVGGGLGALGGERLGGEPGCAAGGVVGALLGVALGIVAGADL